MLLVFCLCPLVAEAQVHFGVKGGFQLTQMEFNTDALREGNRAGFFVGPELKIGLPVSGLAVDVAVLYDQRDLRTDHKVFKQKSIVIPANGRLGVGIGDAFGIFAYAGPQLSFNVGDDMLQWISDAGHNYQYTLQETLLSVNFGAGVYFTKHFEGSVSYNVPVSKTGDFTWDALNQQMQGQTWQHAKSRTNAWRIGVTYYF